MFSKRYNSGPAVRSASIGGTRRLISADNHHTPPLTHGNQASLVEGIAAEKAHAGDNVFRVEAFATRAFASAVSGGRR